MKCAVALACAALEWAGHYCSIVGFCSNTRHFVRLQPVKTDSESIFSEAVLARLAGLTPEWSTRTGAAVRHIASTAARQQARQLLVLVTDGEPHDIDIHDPSYLLEDLRRAVLESRKRGFAFLSIGLGSGPQPPTPFSSAMTSIRLHGPGHLVEALAKGIAMAC
jgi:nitric oxide reductase activation protein